MEETGNALSLIDILLVHPPLCDEGVDNERGFGMCQGVYILEFS